MSIGSFRHLVRVRVPTTSDDGTGGQTVTWGNGPTIFGELRPATAREQAIAGAVQTIATHVFSTHYDARVTVLRRLLPLSPEGAELQVLGVRPDTRRMFMDVDCSEVV